jgi:hypothetical protein
VPGILSRVFNADRACLAGTALRESESARLRTSAEPPVLTAGLVSSATVTLLVADALPSTDIVTGRRGRIVVAQVAARSGMRGESVRHSIGTRCDAPVSVRVEHGAYAQCLKQRFPRGFEERIIAVV